VLGTNEVKLIITGNPIPLKRARANVKSGRMFNSQWKQQEATGWLMRKLWNRPFLCSPVQLDFLFIFEMPKSLSKRNRIVVDGTPCLKVPDLSNLIKYYEDCGNGIIWEDDRLIWKESQRKIWGEDPRTEIIIRWKDD